MPLLCHPSRRGYQCGSTHAPFHGVLQGAQLGPSPSVPGHRPAAPPFPFSVRLGDFVPDVKGIRVHVKGWLTIVIFSENEIV